MGSNSREPRVSFAKQQREGVSGFIGRWISDQRPRLEMAGERASTLGTGGWHVGPTGQRLGRGGASNGTLGRETADRWGHGRAKPAGQWQGASAGEGTNACWRTGPARWRPRAEGVGAVRGADAWDQGVHRSAATWEHLEGGWIGDPIKT
jgi:hypothetical protein